MTGKLGRRLLRLLDVWRRLSALEKKLNRSQQRIENLQNQVRRQQRRISSLSNQAKRAERYNEGRFRNLGIQLDLIKSREDVPQELIEEFYEWKARNPIPEHPLVTIAVATYNRARVLTERCIPSVLGQTYDNLELIVVGDGCTDDTEKRVAKIDDPRLKFVNLPTRDSYPEDRARRWMIAGTRPTNEALSMARGDFICHLDDDDEYLPERLEKLVKLAVEEDCNFLWHPFWREGDEGDWSLIEAPAFIRGQITNGAVLYRSWFARIDSSIDAHRLMEPGDWNRFRRMKYIDPSPMRHPEPLLKKYG